MADISISGLDELEKALQRLAESADSIGMKAVDRAKPIVVKAVRAALTDAAGAGQATGAMVSSVAGTKTGINEYGVYTVVFPMGTDAKGVRNAEKAAYLNYGVRKGYRGHQQAPTYWHDKAVSAAEKGCIDAIEKTVEEEAGQIWD